MVDDRRRFTPRADVRGVLVVLASGLVVTVSGAVIVGAIVLAMRLAGHGS